MICITARISFPLAMMSRSRQRPAGTPDDPDLLSLKAALEELKDVDDSIGSACE